MTTPSHIAGLVERLTVTAARLRDSQGVPFDEHESRVEVDIGPLCDLLLRAHEAADTITLLMEENARLQGLTNNARAASKRAGRDLLSEEAGAALPHFRSEWEPLKDVADRAGARSAAWLASRARDLVARGLVESKWFGAERSSSFKVWRLRQPLSKDSGE